MVLSLHVETDEEGREWYSVEGGEVDNLPPKIYARVMTSLIALYEDAVEDAARG